MHQQSHAPSVDLAIPFWRQFRWQHHGIRGISSGTSHSIEAATNTISRNGAQAQVFNQLQSVADLKRDQIESWISDSTTALTFLLSRPVSDQLIAFAGTPTPRC